MFIAFEVHCIFTFGSSMFDSSNSLLYFLISGLSRNMCYKETENIFNNAARGNHRLCQIVSTTVRSETGGYTLVQQSSEGNNEGVPAL